MWGLKHQRFPAKILRTDLGAQVLFIRGTDIGTQVFKTPEAQTPEHFCEPTLGLALTARVRRRSDSAVAAAFAVAAAVATDIEAAVANTVAAVPSVSM